MMRRGADAATAEDLAQETLLTVWRRASLYAADKGSAATWIFAIARNVRIDRLRREMPLQELPEGRTSGPRTTRHPTRFWPRRSGRPACAPCCRNCRPSSTRWCRSPMSKACRTGRSRRLGLPLGTVKSRMRIAYQKIRPALEDLK